MREVDAYKDNPKFIVKFVHTRQDIEIQARFEVLMTFYLAHWLVWGRRYDRLRCLVGHLSQGLTVLEHVFNGFGACTKAVYLDKVL